MKKIKWKNVIISLTLLGCIGLVLHDMYMLTIHGWITGYMASWTWLGFITFIMAIVIGGSCYEYLEEQIKNVPTENRHVSK